MIDSVLYAISEAVENDTHSVSTQQVYDDLMSSVGIARDADDVLNATMRLSEVYGW